MPQDTWRIRKCLYGFLALQAQDSQTNGVISRHSLHVISKAKNPYARTRMRARIRKYQHTKIDREGILIYGCVCVYAWYSNTLKAYAPRRMTYQQMRIWIPSFKLGIYMHVCVCVCVYVKYQNPKITPISLYTDACAFTNDIQIHWNRTPQDASRIRKRVYGFLA